MPITPFTIFKLVQPHFRRRRMRRFLDAVAPGSGARILDVGGYPSFWAESCLDCKITILNIHPFEVPEASRHQITPLIGDGCDLPFEENAFDIVFSNSVIEHLGTFENQVKFAGESRRVGRALWIQTPARTFPVEPHLITPFIHFFPRTTQRRLLRNFTTWGLLTRPSLEQVEGFLNEVRLLDKAEFRQLYPDCELLEEKFAGMTKSYIALRRNASA